jgi:sugar lactone lactonase YvrE
VRGVGERPWCTRPFDLPVRSLIRCAVVVTIVAVSLSGVPNIASAAPGSELWAKRYNGPGDYNDSASSLVVSPDGTKVFVTGFATTSDGGQDYATLAYEASTGARLWASLYDGRKVDSANALAVSPDGSQVFVTGTSGPGTTSGPAYGTVAYAAATGSQLWAKHYNGRGSGADIANALAVSPDGTAVFVTGYTESSNDTNDYATVAYDALTGAKLWAKRYDKGHDNALALGVSPDGSEVFVTGNSVRQTHGSDYATLAYDASTGAKLWVKRYDGGDDAALALGVSPDGSELFVTGESSGSRGPDYATVAYDASSGAELWVKRYDGGLQDVASALGVTPDGSEVFVTGRSASSSTDGDDYATVAYNASTGAELWVKRYHTAPGNSYGGATALGVSPDGSEVFVTGQTAGSTGYSDYATVAYDAATGAKLWATLYGGDVNDSAFALGVSPNGSEVFVTGTSGPGYADDYATVAYAA